MPGDRGDWWDECVVAAATSKHKRGAFNLICKSQGESEWKEHGECITLEDVYLNRSEYGMGKSTDVYEVQGSTMTKVMSNVGFDVVGAGVSTCAPS